MKIMLKNLFGIILTSLLLIEGNLYSVNNIENSEFYKQNYDSTQILMAIVGNYVNLFTPALIKMCLHKAWYNPGVQSKFDLENVIRYKLSSERFESIKDKIYNFCDADYSSKQQALDVLMDALHMERMIMKVPLQVNLDNATQIYNEHGEMIGFFKTTIQKTNPPTYTWYVYDVMGNCKQQ